MKKTESSNDARFAHAGKGSSRPTQFARRRERFYNVDSFRAWLATQERKPPRKRTA